MSTFAGLDPRVLRDGIPLDKLERSAQIGFIWDEYFALARIPSRCLKGSRPLPVKK